MFLKGLGFFLVFFSLLCPVWGQDFEVSFSVDWIGAEINSRVSFDLGQAGIRLPGGRFLAEEILQEAFPRLFRPCLLSIRYDSNSTIENLLERGEISLRDLDILSMEADKSPPNLSGDLSRMIGNFNLSLEKISAYLRPHTRAFEANRPLVPVQTSEYTGIIIMAYEELPVHGRAGQALAEPSLFPKIWDTNMSLVYDRYMFEAGINDSFLMARYAGMESIFRPSPSGLEGELAALLGPNPLRIFAQGVYGIHPTDLIIDREDALRILSTENNRRLLMEGRVLIVLNDEMLLRGQGSGVRDQ